MWPSRVQHPALLILALIVALHSGITPLAARSPVPTTTAALRAATVPPATAPALATQPTTAPAPATAPSAAPLAPDSAARRGAPDVAGVLALFGMTCLLASIAVAVVLGVLFALVRRVNR
ncbi:MAG: hypothetical protein IPM18_07790 [Phycisphaerales bacterium]|nr:hypothetical protein [Phycisphaerales bacterium]